MYYISQPVTPVTPVTSQSNFSSPGLMDCRTSYTDLVTVSNTTVNSLLQQWPTSLNSYWIGLSRDSWKWSGGANITNTKWESGNPSAHNTDQTCGILNGEAFEDRLCSTRYSFFCHISEYSFNNYFFSNRLILYLRVNIESNICKNILNRCRY